MEIKPNAVFHQRYSVVRPIAGTTTGNLYLGRDITLEQAVLIKFRRSNGPDSDKIFLRSATKLKELNHPNLVRVVDFFVADGLQGLVMDYIPGDNLVTFIQQYGALTLPEMEPWVQKLGDALAYMHAQEPSVFHGDIRPSNLILTPESELILINYGMPELGMETLPQDQAAYAPPELEEKNSKVSASVDQYGLAATLYYLLTKQAPPSAYQRQVEGAGITPLHTLKTQIPATLHPAVAKAMALRPQDRHVSIHGFCNAFISAGKGSAARSSVQPSQPVVATPSQAPAAQPVIVPTPLPPIPVMQTPPPASPKKPKKRTSALLIIIISVVAITMLIGGIILMVNLVRTDTLASANDPSTWPTVTPKPVTPTVQSPTPGLIPTQDLGSEVTPLVGNTLIAYVSNKGDGETYQIWMMAVGMDAAGEIRLIGDTQVTQGEYNAYSPAWSSDGLYLFYTVETSDFGEEIYFVDFTSPNADIYSLTQNHPGEDFSSAISPDSSMVAFTNIGAVDAEQSAIFINDGSSTYPIVSQDAEFEPAWTPDSEYLFFVGKAAGQEGRIYFRIKAENFATRYALDDLFRQGDVYDIALAPNYETIAYTRIEGMQYETPITNIYLSTFSSSGVDEFKLTYSDTDWQPSFSPDSAWIVFNSFRDGNDEIYISSLDGEKQINLTNSPYAEFEPAWQPVPFPNLVEESDAQSGSYGIIGKPFLSNAGNSDGCSGANNTFSQKDPIFLCFSHENTPEGTTAYFSVYDSSGFRHSLPPFDISGSDLNDWMHVSISEEASDTSWAVGSGYVEFYVNNVLFGTYTFEVISSTGGGGG